MKTSFLSILCCPECASPFSSRVFKEGDVDGVPEVEEGILVCKNNDSHWYIVTGHIPRIFPDSLADFPEFRERYGENLPRPKNNGRSAQQSLKQLQEKTKESFGYEWQLWNKFGWDSNDSSLKTTRAIFDYKVMFTPEELFGKLVLDAGCGNGRYSKIAREYGGEVIGIDLSRAVDEAFQNFKGDPKIHFVQGDLFRLPFKNRSFDFIFSNGVLMHTGDAKRAFLSLVTKLNDAGVITIHLYHKGNPVYEFNDWWLRSITTRLPLQAVYIFSKILVKIARTLPKKFVIYGLNILFRIENHEHYVFDWYTAPIATHHTYPEIYNWLAEAGLCLAADHNATKYPWRKWVFPFQFLTVKAQRKPIPPQDIKHTTA